MMKVRILDCCEFCDGEAYVFVCEDVDARGETFDRYRHCEMCHGSGNRVIYYESSILKGD
jgi:RecJ-like exonuclease